MEAGFLVPASIDSLSLRTHLSRFLSKAGRAYLERASRTVEPVTRTTFVGGPAREPSSRADGTDVFSAPRGE